MELSNVLHVSTKYALLKNKILYKEQIPKRQ